MHTPEVYNYHPYGTRPVRKQTSRKVSWRTKCSAEDTSLAAAKIAASR